MASGDVSTANETSGEDMFDQMYNNLEPNRKLLTVVSCNMVEHLDKLITEGMDLNAKLQIQNGNTALHIACQKGHHACVKRLLEADANPDAMNDFGFTPLAMALRHGQVECLQLILSSRSVLVDPAMVWMSQQMSGLPTWLNYNADMIRSLLVATPDFGLLGAELMNHLYENQLKNAQQKELLKMFFMTGNGITTDQMNVVIGAADESLSEWLRGFQSVHSLQHNARLAVRRNLKPNCLKGTQALPIPQKLQEYLVFKEAEDMDIS